MGVPLSGAASAVHLAIARVQRLLEIGLPRLIDRRHWRDRAARSAPPARLRHRQHHARIGLDVRIAGGVDVALRAVEASRLFQQMHIAGGVERAGLPRLDFGVVGLLQDHRQPADFQLRAVAHGDVGAARLARSGWAAPGSGAGPAGRWWRYRR